MEISENKGFLPVFADARTQGSDGSSKNQAEAVSVAGLCSPTFEIWIYEVLSSWYKNAYIRH